MTTPRRIRNQLHALGQLHALATDRSVGALAAITNATAQHDGYPSRASGADAGPGGGDVTSSVERAVEGRLGASERKPGPVEDLRELSDFLASAALAMDHVLRILAGYNAKLSDVERQAMRCLGNDEGECQRWATRKGLCDAHYMAQRRRGAA